MNGIGGLIGGVKNGAGSIIKHLKSGTDKVKARDFADANYQKVLVEIQDSLKGTGSNAYVNYGPADDGFNFPGGTYDPGEVPDDPIGSIFITAEDGELYSSLSGFTPLTYAELETLDTEAKFEQWLLAGDTLLTAGFRDDLLKGADGNDRLSGGAGSDDLYGGTGNDGLNGDSGNDTLWGEAGNDGLFGGVGNDKEYGGAGNDTVHGGDGNDTLKGDAGNDRIIGGFGRDTLTGGTGRDVFLYQTLSKFNGKESGLGAGKRDTITDFKHGQDKIDPSFILVQKFKFLGDAPLTGLGQIHYKYVGANTLVEISTDKDAAAELQIFLKGHITLTKGDFVL